MADEAVENRTLAEQVYHYLRTAIIDERLPGGSDLNEVAIAGELAISRGPVREAMGRLRAEGLVEVRPRRGAVVASLSREEFIDAYQVRIALEVLAVRQGVPRRTEEAVAAIDELTRKLEAGAESFSDEEYFHLNVTVHRLICDLSQNETLLGIYDRLLSRMARYRRRTGALTDDRSGAVAEHRQIAEAIKAGDAEGAADLMDEHLTFIIRRVEELTDEEWDRFYQG
jgi:DNA-binding GntR family transcriptional regulator